MAKALGIALAVLVAGPAWVWADIVHLTNGAKIEGEVVDKGDVLVVTLRSGTTRIAKDKVASIEKAELPWKVYDQRRAELDRAEAEAGKGINAEAHYQLARWCQEHKLKDEQVTEMLLAVRARPDLPGLRQDLAGAGLVEYNGRWMTEAAMRTEQGYVLRDGKWITREEAAALEARTDALKSLRHEEERVRALLANFKDERKREAARAELAKIDPQIRVRPMCEFLRDPCQPLRSYVLDSLGSEIGAPARAAFFKVSLEDRDKGLRTTAVHFLKQFGAADFIPYYNYYLKNDEGFARLWAANASGDLGDWGSVYTLIYTLYKVTLTTRAQNASLNSMRDFPITTAGAGTVNVQLPTVDVISAETTVTVPAGATAEIVRGAVGDALYKITGLAYGDDVDKWVAWWKKEGKELAAAKIQAANAGAGAGAQPK